MANWRAGAGALVLAGALAVAFTATVAACELEHRDSPTEGLDDEPDLTEVSVAQLPPTRSTVELEAVWSLSQILDGDTLVVSGPGGLLEIRLIGIDAPNAGECYHAEAINGLQSFAAGIGLRLLADRSNTDDMGRLLRYVESAQGVDIGAEMVRGGFAVSVRAEPNTSRNYHYEQLQAEAFTAGAGLWGPGVCGH